MTSHEAEILKKHFRNVGSLLRVKINWWLIENLVVGTRLIEFFYSEQLSFVLPSRNTPTS